jgi:mRNA interferase RelE/StbE
VQRRLHASAASGPPPCAKPVTLVWHPIRSAGDPHPPSARRLGGSAYWRLSVGDWRILYEPEDLTVTVVVLKIGRIP